MWVRGLKHQRTQRLHSRIDVAPYVGAWIETVMQGFQMQQQQVAPYVGAWIETETEELSLEDIESRTLCGCVD